MGGNSLVVGSLEVCRVIKSFAPAGQMAAGHFWSQIVLSVCSVRRFR